MNWLQITLVCYAIINIVAGVVGVVHGSVVSLIAAAGLATIVLVGVAISRTRPQLGYGVAALGPVLSLGRFLPTYLKTGALWPALTMVICSAVALIALVAGHFAFRRINP